MGRSICCRISCGGAVQEKSRSRKWAAGAGVAALSVCLSLALAEGAFRAFYTGDQAGCRSDAPSVHLYPENSSGNRDFRYQKEKLEGTFRIIVVGDSFGFGYGGWFDDAFPKRLERILRYNNASRNVEVLNFSIPSYSTRDETRVVKKAIDEYHADLVMLEITLNDAEIIPFEFNTPEFRRRVLPGTARGGIYDYWKSLQFLVNRVQKSRSRRGYVRYFNALFTNPDTLGAFQAGIESIAAQCSAGKVPVAAVVFPLFSFPFNEDYPFAEVHGRIAFILDDNGIPYLDLLPEFEGMNPERLQVEPGKDPHPNAIAHRVAAESLYRWLVKKRLIPAEFIVRKKARERLGPRTMNERIRWEDDL